MNVLTRACMYTTYVRSLVGVVIDCVSAVGDDIRKDAVYRWRADKDRVEYLIIIKYKSRCSNHNNIGPMDYIVVCALPRGGRGFLVIIPIARR